jgi:GntR family transcriptional regulator, transcriptional repressor for pyruvate dehydrogenase complex
MPLEPLHVQSLKEACTLRLEELILSGELQAGARLPAERELAVRLGVSRPVLHEALVDLGAKGLVSILPRRGVVVNDFRKAGSTAILSSLLEYHQGALDPDFVQSLFGMRMLVETETARLAALNASPVQRQELEALLEREAQQARCDGAALTALDFEFHLLISLASANLVYPLILNSFKKVYTHFTGLFFARWGGTPVVDEVFAFHHRLVEAVCAGRGEEAALVMTRLLAHGEEHLKGGN